MLNRGEYFDRIYKLINYSNNYPSQEQNENIIQFLANEYEGIIKFTKEWISWYRADAIELPIIPVVISEKTPTQKYTMSNRELAEAIVIYLDGKYNKGNTIERIDKTEEIINNAAFTSKITGCYHNSGYMKKGGYHLKFEATSTKPYIEIFLKNFSYDNKEELFVQLSNCLAHEYFHFIHNYFVGRSFTKRGRPPFTTKAVKESLADFFALVYTLSEYTLCDNLSRKKYASQRFNLWAKRFHSSWPYAHALYYYYNDEGQPVTFSDYYKDYFDNSNGCLNKFMNVLETSRKSMEAAYDVLVN